MLTTTLVDFTTMDPDLQNAYSTQASVEVERSLGHGRTVSIGYQYLRGSNLLMSVNQNVPTCVAAGHQQRLPARSRHIANNSQYSSAGESNYHGLHVSFVQRPTRLVQPARELHAVEVDERSRRGVLQLADRSRPTSRATGAGQTTTSGIGS